VPDGLGGTEVECMRPPGAATGAKSQAGAAVTTVQAVPIPTP